jgi:hypothetical protein
MVQSPYMNGVPVGLSLFADVPNSIPGLLMGSNMR